MSPAKRQVSDSSNSTSAETAVVIVAVIVPAVVIAIVVLCFFQIQKHWKLRHAQAMTPRAADNIDERAESEDVQLYLQNKAELSVERQGDDIQPKGEVYELMDQNQCQEMPGKESRQPMLSLGERHELPGEEHARELESSQYHRVVQQDATRYSFDEPNFVDFNESVLSLHEFA